MKFVSAMQVLGINPISLAPDSSKFIALVRLLNTKAVTLGYQWAIQLFEKAKSFGYRIEADSPHGGYGYHIHISGENGRLVRLHIQVVKKAWDYIKSRLR